MKKWIAMLLAACLMFACAAAFAEGGAPADAGTALPGPEDIAGPDGEGTQDEARRMKARSPSGLRKDSALRSRRAG